MRIPNRIQAWTAAWCLVVPLASADELLFQGSARQRLSGEVTAIDEQGVVEIASPLSRTPLRLQPDALARIRFAEENSDRPATDTLAVLANGDRLPITLHTFTQANGLVATSPGLPSLTLPASHLASLEFGVEHRRPLFRGPGHPSAWSSLLTAETPQSPITVENDSWIVAGSAEVARSLPITRDFLVRFRLRWAQGSQPNFRVSFAHPSGSRDTKVDRYLLQFGRTGFEVKRESAQGEGPVSVLMANRTPDSFAHRDVEVELQVKRSQRRIALVIQGETEAWGIDPVEGLPDGDGWILSFTGTSNTTQTLSDLHIDELQDTRIPHRAEDRGDATLDALITRKDDRWSGTVCDIQVEHNEKLLRFDAPPGDSPLEIPLSEVSTLWFRASTIPAPPAPARFRVDMRGGGSLRTPSCLIRNGKLTLQHALLGTLEIPKTSILRIENLRAETPHETAREQE